MLCSILRLLVAWLCLEPHGYSPRARWCPAGNHQYYCTIAWCVRLHLALTVHTAHDGFRATHLRCCLCVLGCRLTCCRNVWRVTGGIHCLRDWIFCTGVYHHRARLPCWRFGVWYLCKRVPDRSRKWWETEATCIGYMCFCFNSSCAIHQFVCSLNSHIAISTQPLQSHKILFT